MWGGGRRKLCPSGISNFQLNALKPGIYWFSWSAKLLALSVYICDPKRDYSSHLDFMISLLFMAYPIGSSCVRFASAERCLSAKYFYCCSHLCNKINFTDHVCSYFFGGGCVLHFHASVIFIREQKLTLQVCLTEPLPLS